MTNENKTEEEIAAEALAAFSSLVTSKEIETPDFPAKPETIKVKKETSSKVKQYKLFSSSILLCYIQGDAPALFMQRELSDYSMMLGSADNEIKEFLNPLFSLLHDNKNIVFRPLNLRLLSSVQVEAFNAILESFRNETRLTSFLNNYKTFLSFLASCNLPIKKENIFTSLSDLLILIADYRDNASTLELKQFPELLSPQDIKDLTF